MPTRYTKSDQAETRDRHEGPQIAQTDEDCYSNLIFFFRLICTLDEWTWDRIQTQQTRAPQAKRQFSAQTGQCRCEQLEQMQKLLGNALAKDVLQSVARGENHMHQTRSSRN